MIKNIKNRIIPCILVFCFLIVIPVNVKADRFDKYKTEMEGYFESDYVIVYTKPKIYYNPLIIPQKYYSEDSADSNNSISYHSFIDNDYYHVAPIMYSTKIRIIITNLTKNHKYVIKRKTDKSKKWKKVKKFKWSKSSIGENSTWYDVYEDDDDEYEPKKSEFIYSSRSKFLKTYTFTDKKLKAGTKYYYKIYDKTTGKASQKQTFFTACDRPKKAKQKGKKLLGKK